MKSMLAMAAVVMALAGCHGGYGHRMDTSNPNPSASHPQGPDGKVHAPR